MWLFNGPKSRKTISASTHSRFRYKTIWNWVKRRSTIRVDRCQFDSSFMNFLFFSRVFSGSLPPSPADSGVSDVDSSSSGGQTCSDELKARLGLPSHCPPQNHVPPGPFLNPNYYHNSPPLRNIWSNRSVTCKYPMHFVFLLYQANLNSHKFDDGDDCTFVRRVSELEMRKQNMRESHQTQLLILLNFIYLIYSWTVYIRILGMTHRRWCDMYSILSPQVLKRISLSIIIPRSDQRHRS